jgi:hypothetical protein
MELVLFYFALAAVVGVAANARGRSAVGWFLLSLVISPLIAGLLVIALPRIGASADQSFKPAAVLKGSPYRLRKDGTIDAMMPGGLVHFRDVEQFRAAVDGRDTITGAPALTTDATALTDQMTTPLPTWAVNLMWGWVVFFAAFFALLLIASLH